MSKWALRINIALAVATLLYITAIGGWSDKVVWMEVGFWFLIAFAVVEIIDALIQKQKTQA